MNTMDCLMNVLPVAIYWIDKHGVYQGCNFAQAMMFGFSTSADIVGKTSAELPLFKDNQLGAAQLDQMHFQTMKEGKQQISEELLFKEGEQRVYLMTKSPIFSAENEITALVVMSIDITNINENVSSKIALENILNNLPGHVYWKNLEGYYLGCNIQQARSCGFNSPDEVIGKTDYDMPWREQADLYRANDLQVMRTGVPVLAEEEGTLESGEVRTFLANKIPLRSIDKKIIGVLGISLDISEQKKMQAALKKAEGQIEGMTLVSAAMAHELRTPLATITMGMEGIEKYLQILLETYELAQQHQLKIKLIPPRLLNNLSKAVTNIKSETKHANMIVNMLLANLSFQKHQQSRKELSMAQCIQDALDQYVFPGDKRNLIYLDLKEDFAFYGDEILLSHILFNFLKNSLYFIEKARKGEIFITLKRSNEFNELHFKDTAQGVQAENLPKIFDQFYTKDTHHGTGIGLAFCKAVMESWHGKISCQSKYREYIEFTCFFGKN
jgi:two-component system, OmpR family, aerobic respiration control sensor histidine kinase ArcB